MRMRMISCCWGIDRGGVLLWVELWSWLWLRLRLRLLGWRWSSVGDGAVRVCVGVWVVPWLAAEEVVALPGLGLSTIYHSSSGRDGAECWDSWDGVNAIYGWFDEGLAGTTWVRASWDLGAVHGVRGWEVGSVSGSKWVDWFRRSFVLLSHHSGLASWDWIERVLFSVCIWLGNQTDSSLACLSLCACLVSPGGDANWSVC
jgi:hypothetical protein